MLHDRKSLWSRKATANTYNSHVFYTFFLFFFFLLPLDRTPYRFSLVLVSALLSFRKFLPSLFQFSIETTFSAFFFLFIEVPRKTDKTRTMQNCVNEKYWKTVKDIQVTRGSSLLLKKYFSPVLEEKEDC